MEIQFVGLASDLVSNIRSSMADAYGLPVEVHPAAGDGCPCRHCLTNVPEGQGYLILAHRPFSGLNPYTETGPIFLCAVDCISAAPGQAIPDILRSQSYLVRAYDRAERIIYGSGKVTPTGEIVSYAKKLFADPTVAFIDVRSASNNCFQCRIQRA